MTEEQRQALLEDGAIVIPGVLNEEWIEYRVGATDLAGQQPTSGRWRGLGLYDYIQRSVWASNTAFAKLLYYSPTSALAGSINAKRAMPGDDLLREPNKCARWHQDNQNGLIDAFGEPGRTSGMRRGATLDDACPTTARQSTCGRAT